MKLSELIKLGEKKEAKYIDAPEALQYNNESYLKTEGYNQALSDLANMEIGVDEDKIRRCIKGNIYKSQVTVNGRVITKIRGYGKASHAIASQLPKFLKGK